MVEQVVPDTENSEVALVSVAWEIVRRSNAGHASGNEDADRIKLTNSFIEVYQALYNMKPIQSDKQGK